MTVYNSINETNHTVKPSGGITMTDYEYVSELTARTGASFEEARFVYESCGKDFAAAEKELEEKRKKNMDIIKEREMEEMKRNIKENAKKAADYSGGILKKLARNNLSISASREFVTLPILAAIIITLLTWEVAVPAMIISLFCGVKYTFSGPDFDKDFVLEIKSGSSKSDKSSYEPASYTESYTETKTEEKSVEYTYPQYDREEETSTDKGFFN